MMKLDLSLDYNNIDNGWLNYDERHVSVEKLIALKNDLCQRCEEYKWQVWWIFELAKVMN